MKRILSVLFCLILFIGVFASPAAASSLGGRTHTFFISIYNSVTKQYVVENRSLTVSGEKTIYDSIDALQTAGVLTGFQHNVLQLTQVSYRDENRKEVALSNSGGNVFYAKVNGSVLPADEHTQYIVDGDIIEWIYGPEPPTSVPEIDDEPEIPDGEEPSVPTELWDETTAAAMDDACIWLDQNLDSSTFYLVAIGSAGKTADVSMVNKLLTEVKQKKKYDSPTEIARNILKLSYCGFDTSNADNAALLAALIQYDNIMSQGIFGAINTLVAYDCRNYAVDNSATNNRNYLVSQILSFQQEGGGFSIQRNSEEDIDTTAMAITALSAYRSQQEVADAIDRAVNFLVASQTETGGFGYQGQENCESLAQVIIAFSSIGIKLDDSRFTRGGKNLLDQLMEYRLSDGGFAHLKEDGQSSAMPTEQAVIALASIKKNGNPYRVPSTSKNVVTPSEQTPLHELRNDLTGYIIVAAVLVALVGVAVGAAIWLKKSKGDSVAPDEAEKSDESDNSGDS